MQVLFASKRPVTHIIHVRMELQDQVHTEVISITVITEQLPMEHLKSTTTVLVHRIVKIQYGLEMLIMINMVVLKI